MERVGGYFSEGLANGINNKAWKVYEQADTIATNAIRRLNKALQIKSPSRVTMRSGLFFGEGLALGIEDMTNRVGEAAKEIGVIASGELETALTPGTGFGNIGLGEIGDISASMAQAITANGALKVTVPVLLDGREIGEAVVDYNNGVFMRTGASPLMI
jgi:hypothetical protein